MCPPPLTGLIRDGVVAWIAAIRCSRSRDSRRDVDLSDKSHFVAVDQKRGSFCVKQPFTCCRSPSPSAVPADGARRVCSERQTRFRPKSASRKAPCGVAIGSTRYRGDELFAAASGAGPAHRRSDLRRKKSGHARVSQCKTTHTCFLPTVAPLGDASSAHSTSPK